jgi:hypothetical protein
MLLPSWSMKVKNKMGMKARKELNERNLSELVKTKKFTTRDIN